MKSLLPASLLAIGLLCGVRGGALADADMLILANARVYTVDVARSRAEAVAIDGEGVIAAVGSGADLIARFPGAEIVDLGGRMVLPGFQDAHLHAVEAGLNDDYCGVSQFGDEATYRRELQACARGQAEEDWVMGAGVNIEALLETTADPLALIDAAIPDKPAVMIDDVGHGAWANSRALAEAGFDRLQRDPSGGILERGPDGRLNGVVLESLSQTLVDAAEAGGREYVAYAAERLGVAMRTLAANGITTVSDAGGYWRRGHERVWLLAEHRGLLTVRANNALYFYPESGLGGQIGAFLRRRYDRPGALVRFNQVKIYVDGVLTQATAALHAPYEAGLGLAEADRLGFEYFDPERLNRIAKAVSEAGFQLHFHVAGDRAVTLALNAIVGADPAAGPHRLTHLYLVDPSDMPRFAQLGVVADFQIAPSSLTPGALAELRERIGERVERLTPLRALYDAGALITLSSDWDADALSPLLKLQTVLTHPRNGPPDLAAAIEMITINPARLLRHADRTGSIEPGKFADLVVLAQDLFEAPTERLGSVEVAATLLQGEPTYDPMGLFASD